MSKAIDLTGQQFGRWTVVRREGRAKDGHTSWECRCACGTSRVVCGYALQRGRTQSCGCLAAELTSRRSKTHGAARHGRVTPEYHTWKGMRERCENTASKDYSRYGGRGIRVCDRWKDFENFLVDMGFRPPGKPTLDRIDGTQGYRPGNCRWATWLEQEQNRHNVIQIAWDGRTQCVAAWARERGMKYTTLMQRIKRGWSTERATMEPVR